MTRGVGRAEDVSEFTPRRQVLEVLSWHIAAELARRHPSRLRVVELHPGGGQYDCLAIIDRADPDGGAVHLNRAGGVHVLRRFDETDPVADPYRRLGDFWGRALQALDPKDSLVELERGSGLTTVTQLPPSTSQSLSYRVAAASIAPTTLGRRRWEWRSGFLDSSGGGGSAPREDMFRAFPSLASRRTVRVRDDPLAPEYRFWFLCRNEDPIAAIEDVGRGWNRAGEEIDLMRLYSGSGRRLAPLVKHLLGDDGE